MSNSIMVFANRFLFVAMSIYATVTNADNYEGYSSRIEGIGLWWLEYSFTEQEKARFGTTDIVVRRLRFGENPEFAIYCNGTNKLYIYEMSSQGFTCKLEYLEEWQGWDAKEKWSYIDRPGKKKLLQLIELAREDKQGNARESQYYVSLGKMKIKSPGIFTVSKRKLERGNWAASFPKKEDLRTAKNIALENYKQISAKNSHFDKIETVIGYDDSRIVKMAERYEGSLGEVKYKKEKYTVKISTPNIEIILLPTQYQYKALGGELVSTVVLKKDGDYSFLGHVPGCMLSVGADLDADGVPEIIMQNCANSEGTSITYFKLYPTIKPLVVYEHN